VGRERRDPLSSALARGGARRDVEVVGPDDSESTPLVILCAFAI